MEATTDWKMGAGHTLQPHSLGIADKCPPPPPRTQPKFPSFVWDLEGAQTYFIFRDQTTGYLKSHHLQAWVTLTALSVPPRQHFLSAEFWVIRYHLVYLGREQFKFLNYALPYILAMRKKNYYYFFGHSRPLREWGNPESGTEYNLHTILNAIKCKKKIGAVFPKIYHFFHEK